MEYTVEITLQTKRPLTERALFDIAEIGGVAVGAPGSRHLEATFTVSAEDVRQAADVAIEKVSPLVAGNVVAIEAITTAEADRRLAQRPRLVGVAEIAKLLGVSRQRVSTLSQREDFPTPAEQLAAGPVWRAGDLSTFAAGWHRRPGRPKGSKAEDNQTGK